jgi:hypothetical protein
MAMVETGLRVLSKNIDLELRKAVEGRHFNLVLATTNQTFGTGVTSKNLSGGFTVYPDTELVDAKGQIISLKVDPAWAAGTTPSAYPGRGLILYFNAGAGAPTNYFPRQGVRTDYAEFGPINKAFTEGSTFNTVAQRGATNDGDVPFYTAGSLGGTLMTKGWDKPSDFDIPVIGDSISEYSAFTSGNGDKLFLGMLRAYYKSLGYTPRTVNKAKGGSNSANIVAQQIAGELDFTTAVNKRVCHVMVMTNDMLQAYAANGNNLTQPQIDALIVSYMVNMTKIINYHIATHGNSFHLIVAGAPPVSNTVQEGALVQMRNALRTYIGSIGGGVWDGGAAITPPANKIWFISYGATSAQSGSFTATDTSKYIETTGNRIHPNDSGNADIGATSVNFVTLHDIR